jgi:hypothetical protein
VRVTQALHNFIKITANKSQFIIINISSYFNLYYKAMLDFIKNVNALGYYAQTTSHSDGTHG